jgi:hypothetical protein
MIDLGTLNGHDFSFANGVNDRGDVVGTSRIFANDASQRAFCGTPRRVSPQTRSRMRSRGPPRAG